MFVNKGPLEHATTWPTGDSQDPLATKQGGRPDYKPVSGKPFFGHSKLSAFSFYRSKPSKVLSELLWSPRAHTPGAAHPDGASGDQQESCRPSEHGGLCFASHPGHADLNSLLVASRRSGNAMALDQQKSSGQNRQGWVL